MFTWGAGDAGKLGLGVVPVDDDMQCCMLVPALVRGELQKGAVMQVAAGASHSMCATEGGSVYTWGNNDYDQLGVVDVDDPTANLPVLVQTLDNDAIGQSMQTI